MPLTIKDKNSNSSPPSVLYDANKKTKAVHLPHDVILFQIITRVPTKSVICFKCVSKQWNAFLMSDRFKEMHSLNHLKDHHLKDQKLLFFSKEAAMFFTIDCESLPNKAPCPRPLPQFEAYSPFEDMRILTSYNGLVCLGIRKSYNDGLYSDIIFWNPLTTEYKRLSKPANPDHMECHSRYGKGHRLYYRSCEDDYKLLVVTDESFNVYIYSLKSDSWRKFDKAAPFQEGYYWRPSLCLNENIYFLSILIQGSIRFDTTAERFHKIRTPPFYNDNNKPYSTTITVHKGSILLCVKCNIRQTSDILKSTCIELWKFNADSDIWSKVVTYQLTPTIHIRNFYPLHLMSNGNWLMMDRDRICQVDLKKKKYTKYKNGHKSEVKNQSKGNCYDEYNLLYYTDIRGIWPQHVRYTETFVSPNQYMK